MNRTEKLISNEEKEARFFNRELSWLSFNERVLSQYLRPDVPLGEKLRFIAISANNLDEFFMVRIAGLRQLEKRGYLTVPGSDERLDELLTRVLERSVKLQLQQQTAFNFVLSQLSKVCEITDIKNLNKQEHHWLTNQFSENILPLLSPTTLDPVHPFPFIQNKGKGLFLELLTQKDELIRAVILLPDSCPRFIKIPGALLRFVKVEDAITKHINLIFPKYQIKKAGMFRILRDSEMQIDDEASDLLSQFESSLKRRRRGEIVSLVISDNFSKATLNFLKREMQTDTSAIYQTKGLVGLQDVNDILRHFPQKLLFKKWNARLPQRIIDFNQDIFAAIKQKDLLVHHPFEEFDVVIKLLEQAANDPDVLAIRQTLYRTTSDSPIAQALKKAAENGKAVTAVIELKARFDEANNIKLARELEKAGAQVTYGLGQLKVHSKLSLIMREEDKKIVSYVHCGTGNYHPANSKTYTDYSFFTCEKSICEDVRLIFNFLTSYVQPDSLVCTKISPNSSHQWFLDCLDNEIANAKAGKPAFFIGKANALLEKTIIKKLYDASNAGVKITLFVRGICGLRPGVIGMSENIKVFSIIGRYLEHGRFYVFGNGDAMGSKQNQLFLSSADLMHRNLFNRVEIFLPILNTTLRKQFFEQIIPALISDNINRWELKDDGSYLADVPKTKKFSSHNYFMETVSLSGQGSSSEHFDN